MKAQGGLVTPSPDAPFAFILESGCIVPDPKYKERKKMRKLKKWAESRYKEFGVINEKDDAWMRGYYTGWRASLRELEEKLI